MQENAAISGRIKQLSSFFEKQEQRMNSKMREAFCLLFTDTQVCDLVESKGLPKTIFANPEDFYFLVETVGRYFQIIPDNNLKTGELSFSWIELNDVKTKRKNGHEETATFNTEDREGVVNNLY